MKLSSALSDFARYLEEKRISLARRQAEEVVADALRMRRSELYWQADRELTAGEFERCKERIWRRGQYEPCQYLSGEVEFLELRLKVTPAVLIPRQETEILADRISQLLVEEKGVLWDICCGSGCIGLSLKKRAPHLKVILSDLSPQALAIAAANATLNGVDVALRQGDLLAPFCGERAQFIVCNPPYISEADWEELDPEVHCYEPRLSLVGGKTGLEFYERLAEELPPYLASKAKLFFEIGHKQGEAVRAIFNSPFWRKISIERDLAGKERFFSVETE